MKEIIELLLDYIDKKIEYEFESRQEDESGYRIDAWNERKNMEKSKNKIINYVIKHEEDYK